MSLHVSTVIEHIPNASFKNFAEQVAQARLDGTRHKDRALIAEMMKLISNSLYGRTITNIEKHHDIVYIDESEISTEIIDNHFYDMTELTDGITKWKRQKRKLTLTFPFTLVSLY